VLAHRHIRAAEGDHICPDLVHVGGAGKVDHIRGKAAAGAHIDLQCHELALFAHAGLILGHAEELKVDESALHAKALDGGTTGGASILGQVLDDIVDGVIVVIDDVHDGHRADVARLKDGVAAAVNDGIVAVDLGADELLHDIGKVGVIGALVEQEALQLLIAGQLMGIGGTHTVVRLDHHRIAHLVDELLAALQVVHHVVTCGGDAGLLVILLHLALVLDAGHILGLEAGLDVEVRAQGRIPLQPVLIVRFQPVDAAILEGEERHRPVDLVIILQTADLVVFVQAVLQLRLQLIIGLVTDAQHVHAVVFQLPAELPVVGGEIGGDKDKVLHSLMIPLLS